MPKKKRSKKAKRAAGIKTQTFPAPRAPHAGLPPKRHEPRHVRRMRAHLAKAHAS